MRWRHHESIHVGLRIWEIWTPELLWPAHVEAARNRRSGALQGAPNDATERRPSPSWPQRRTAPRARHSAESRAGLVLKMTRGHRQRCSL